MEVEKHEIIHIRMHSTEADRFLLLLEQIGNGQSNMPSWAKEEAEKLIEKIERVKK